MPEATDTYVLSCVFCNPHLFVADWERLTGEHTNGYFIYAATPLNPVTPGHKMIIPIRHLTDALTDPVATGAVFAAAARYAARNAAQPVNLITSVGEAASQSVMHLQVHVVPRRPMDGLKLPWTGQSTKEP